MLPPVGRLIGKASFHDHYFEGEKGKMSIKLSNHGEKPINEVHIAVGEE